MSIASYHLKIKGVVQGVGFRPFVYREAVKSGLNGKVLNDQEGVLIFVEGEEESVLNFIEEIKHNPPPLSNIRSLDVNKKSRIAGYQDFKIEKSAVYYPPSVEVTVDTSVCDNCLMEMNDSTNRRFEHPFITCTDCGPRYTIIEKLPYDRCNTTMKQFPMCESCNDEYTTPSNRRFHAEPICCNACGPRLSLLDKNGVELKSHNLIKEAASKINNGNIVAIKGIGGYHIVSKADDSKVVATLRERKDRLFKPFAIMARDLDSALKIADIKDTEKNLLSSIESPILLCEKRDNSLIAPNVAPNVNTFGIMLPYTPIHHLLFKYLGFDYLIMTSANLTEEPIVCDEGDALRELKNIVDCFLTHDREIYTRNDDSIVKITEREKIFMRKARGFVPSALKVPYDVTGIIGTGGVLKSSFAVGREDLFYVSQYLGEINNLKVFQNFEKVFAQLLSILNVKPELFVIDAHPNNFLHNFTDKFEIPKVKVLHHHAHAAACMAENEIYDKIIAVVYDGTGYGDDNTVWGGEIFSGDFKDLKRVGHLLPVPMPGGESAIKNPKRMAMGALFPLIGEAVYDLKLNMDEEEKKAVLEILKNKINSPLTSSMGRLFDAVSALLGICENRTYEGQPAIELEAICDKNEAGIYDIALIQGKKLIINSPIILQSIIEDLNSGGSKKKIASKFHNTIAHLTAKLVKKISDKENTYKVCLSGGCFMNSILLAKTKTFLEQENLKVFTHIILPPNDECVSFGQAVIAAARRHD